MSRPDRWKDGTPNILVRLQGLGQDISKVVIYLSRHGAPPVKPEVVVANEYIEDPLFTRLFDITTRVTGVMSECKWDDSLLDTSAQMDTALLGFTTQLQKIRKQKGEETAGKMLDAALEKIEKTNFMQSLPDKDIVVPHWREALRTHFDLAMHPPKRR